MKVSRSLYLGLLLVLGVGSLPGQSRAGRPEGLHGFVWIQAGGGWSTGDDRVSGQLDADVSVSNVPLLEAVSAKVPLGAEVNFTDPTAINFGGELVYRRIGLEVNAIYLPEGATGSGYIPVCGGLLTEAECQLLRQGTLLTPGIELPNVLLAEASLANLAVTVGANYHVITNERWDLWAGPMAVWSVWDKYDISDVRVDLTTSLESLIKGKVDKFEPSNYPDVSPQDALTFGMSFGTRYNFWKRMCVQGQFRYFAGGEAELPGGEGRYAVAGFTVGIAYRVG